MDKQPSERRQHVRIQARFAVMMKLDGNKFPDYTMEAEIINISEGGVLLSLPDKRTSQNGGQDVDANIYYGDLQFESLLTWLQFRLPTSGELVRVVGIPTWVRRPEEKSNQCLLALRFTHVTPEDQERLSTFINDSLTTAS